MAEAGNDLEKLALKENNREEIKNVFQAVLERPPSERDQFLSEVCKENESIRNEVRELLESFEENDSFFERGAIGEIAGIFTEDEKLKTGKKIGRYKIKSAIGAGGMGEVFLAEDTELDRPVALKVLSKTFSNDDKRIRRFIQEAKSVSALNHPNILTIHEIGQIEGVHFIATEYVKGETLRRKLKQKRLTLHEILDIAEQVASALNAAHQAKIIHRDIKPENIMIRDDGLVKVLDFGLAKLIGQNQYESGEKNAPQTQVNTSHGMIMGTIAYMSPEQTRAKDTDERTDIWSFGVCLYEMISGFNPFAGETTSDIIASILKTDPPLIKGNFPLELKRIIEKSLRKQPQNRYHNINDLIVDLKTLRRKLDDSSLVQETGEQRKENFGETEFELVFTNDTPLPESTKINYAETSKNPVSQIKSKNKDTWLALSIAALFLTVVGFGLYYFAPRFRQTASFEAMRFTKLTHSGSVAGEKAAISPDGKYAAFILEEIGKEQGLWLKDLAGSENISIIPPANVIYNGISFSRDGNFIYYSFSEKKGSAPSLYRISFRGGEAVKLLDDVGSSVTFSPDGKQMAFIRAEKTIMIADADGKETKLLAAAAEGRRWSIIEWSPDGEKIAAAVHSASDANIYLVEVSVKDGTEKLINSPPWLRVSGLVWTPDNKGLIISGRDFETKLLQVWLINYPDGARKRITNDLSSYNGLSLSADGRKISAIQVERLSNIWLSTLTENPSEWQMTFDKGRDEGMSGVSIGSDGKIVYTTRIAGVNDIWSINSDGTENRQLTNDARTNFVPMISPDNRYIVFVSNRSGTANIWRMNLDGSNQKPLTESRTISGLPTFSPDGNWVFYQVTGADNKPSVWKVNIEGGEPVQMTDVYSGKPSVSPDGKYFACVYGENTTNSTTKIAIIPNSGGKPEKILDLPLVVKSPLFRWTADGRGFIYIDNRGREFNLWMQSLDNSQPKKLTNFSSEEIFRFELSKDGKNAVLARGYEASDVIMIENFR